MPSRRAALAWWAWSSLAMGQLLAASMPWPLRIGSCLVLAWVVWRVVRRFVLLRGPRALRAVEWREPAEVVVQTGSGHRLAAVPAPGCRQYGTGLWILRFDTTSGAVSALLDTGLQDPAAMRKLSRRLGWGEAAHSGLPPTAS